MLGSAARYLTGVFILIVFINSIAGVKVRDTSQCSFTDGASDFYNYDVVMNCFKSVPWNETVKQTTLDSLSKAMQLYAFLDIATNPPSIDHFYPPVDLLTQFERIRAFYFETDYDFHLAIRNVFLQLHDAHTNYYAPLCYASFTFYQPFSPVSYITDNGDQVIGISKFFDTNVYNYYLNKGVNLTDFVGAKIVSIDDEPALAHIIKFANYSVGSAKDPATRFNIALGMPTPYNNAYTGEQWLGLFSTRISHFIPAPTNASVKYAIRFPNNTLNTYTFPWIASTGVPYADFNALVAGCFEPNFATKAAEKMSQSRLAIKPPTKKESGNTQKRQKVVSLKDTIDVKKLHKIYQERKIAIAKNGGSDFPYPIVNSTTSGVGVYQLDSKTLVIYINTFEPADYYAFQSAIVEGMFFANYYNLDRLLLDLTLNGGGDICLGRSMLRFLFPEGPNFSPTDMPSSPLAINLTRTAANYNVTGTEWSPSFYQNQNQTYWANNDTTWLIPGIPHVRGGLLRNYSQFIHIGDDVDSCGAFPIKELQPFSPNKTILITKGFCGSTCALFSNHIHQYYGVKTLTVGGIQGQQQQYTSFPGLEVLETPGFYVILDTLGQQTRDQGCKSCLAPRRLITNGGYRLCIREIYGPINNFTVPLEYTWQPSDFHIDNNWQTAQNPEYIWALAAKFFNQ